ncbi:acyl-CoA dehydrogenase NM domain-like protein [Piedraia hortae CBS 480.64]|uniref:Acyl-CoA dehydrogenase NM domain-like protein n=1 Tax=Piedraia hortae CBS 480.64 TaxID=1314780 RepID=A0A6A7BT51_9PEZI|nr:acyl-CoA dehydrogenase NM domain-like protein [Piedraia hortae CBS 480.64]
MSVPYSINVPLQGKASDRIPLIARPFVSDRAKETLDLVERFVEEECIPADAVYNQQIGVSVTERFSAHPQVVEDLKVRARKLGLWNLFLPRNHFKEGAGFSNLEYGLMAEYLGKSITSQVATNCAAPDTGNMEVLAKYGTEEQKSRWLVPLLEGKIRSAFLMTEPDVASSDATNISLTITRSGNEYILNGSKWWSSGAGDPNCELYIVMGKSDPSNPNPYRQQNVVFVPAASPGITIKRMLSVFGYDDAPHGHGHITFNNVRVPVSNICLGEGRGFDVIQGRLGPGRIHHAMRSIGAAEKALELFIFRLNDPRKRPFKQPLSTREIMLHRVALTRMEIDAARLLVLNTAITIDSRDAKFALKDIAEAKVLVPKVLLDAIDRAIQVFGAEGVNQDTDLPRMYASARTMRIVDGPDEVHLLQLGRNENKRGAYLREKIEGQKKRAQELAKKYGATLKDPLELNRVKAKL